MKLISMTDFVLEQVRKMESKEMAYFKIFNYAQFLKQPLTLGMFIPCDEEGNIMEDLKYCCDGHHCGCMGMPINVCSKKDIDNYYKAKERVLFEGWKIIHQDKVRITIECDCLQLDWSVDYNSFTFYKSIEELSHLNFELTEASIKQIGL